jgi:GDP-D-mannose dehydratase
MSKRPREEVEAQRKVALITGITGQDGSYLAELLLSKNYDVSAPPLIAAHSPHRNRVCALPTGARDHPPLVLVQHGSD